MILLVLLFVGIGLCSSVGDAVGVHVLDISVGLTVDDTVGV